MNVLVVDDDPLILELIQRGLREDGDTVDVAASGAEGERFAASTHYDAIVLDLVLPDTSGFEVVERMRRNLSSVPVLMLTSRQGTEAKIQGLDAGADENQTKPVDVGELKARLRALTRRGSGVRSEAVGIGSLVLDRMTHEVRIGSKHLRLTPKEYKLLEYFMLRADQVVTRSDLLENVWDIHFDPGSNIVDAHVARMRGKLRSAEGAPQLETIRGAGFKLTSP
jgi:DNA-binding response OmpR family regulator